MKPGRQRVSSPRRSVAAIGAIGVFAAAAFAGLGVSSARADDAGSALPAGVFCQGPQTGQPGSGPHKVILLDLENESATKVQTSPDAPFLNGVVATQCGTFTADAMHSTTHGSESNYLAQASGLNAAIGTGSDAPARFGLSDCPPDSTSAGCAYGGGHFDSSIPSVFSQTEQAFGTAGWKVYADDMPAACTKVNGPAYATDGAGKKYLKYVARHNPAVFFAGIACDTSDLPSGDWRSGQGPLYDDLTNGTLPAFTFIEPNDIENGHDPPSVNGVTIAGGTSQIANLDSYLSDFLTLVQASPDYQSGNLIVMVTFDEGTKAGPIPGEGYVGENCADPNVSPLATSCQVATYILGRYVPAYGYSTYMNHFGLLAAAQRILGLSPILGHAADATTPDIVNGTADNPNPFNLAPPDTFTPPPPTVPSPPLTVSAGTPSGGAVTVSFSPPASDGGSPITGYTVTGEPGDLSATGTGSPITVSGLTLGTTYTFTVTATNGNGSSAPSAPSNAVTYATVPGPPTNVVATAGNLSAVVRFSPPSDNGGAAITGYTARSSPGNVVVHGAASPLTVKGLTAGTAYTFTVSATNSAGTGPASDSSPPVTPYRELLPDPGFESGNDGFSPQPVGVLTRVSSPVHGGKKALRVAATSSKPSRVGIAQRSVISKSVAGRSYLAQCYVRPTGPNLDVSIRFLEYTPTFSKSTALTTVTVVSLPTNAWTLVQVTGKALKSGDHMVPQLYSTKETTLTGSLVFDDCSVR